MARKKKRVYVAPVGVDLYKENEGETEWHYLAYCCKTLRTWIPYAPEPETMGWSDPSESIRKERLEKLEIEQDYSGEARDAFAELLSTWKWPETSKQAAFLMGERLLWAERMCNLLDGVPLSGGCVFLLPPESLSLRDKLIFLTGGFYDAIGAVPVKWWDSCSFQSYYE